VSGGGPAVSRIDAGLDQVNYNFFVFHICQECPSSVQTHATGKRKEIIMRDPVSPNASADRELRWFVEDYCGCGPQADDGRVDEACADAALMLAQRDTG
jgi:hypothetical protein